MALKITLWVSALLFVATIWNVAGAYSSMGDTDVQAKFQNIGLLGGTAQTSAQTASIQ